MGAPLVGLEGDAILTLPIPCPPQGLLQVTRGAPRRGPAGRTGHSGINSPDDAIDTSESDGQRGSAGGAVRPLQDPAGSPARGAWADRYQARLRARGVRRLRGAGRRRAAT